MKFLPYIVQIPSDVGKKCHAETLLPDFSSSFLSSAKRASYTRYFRVRSNMSKWLKLIRWSKLIRFFRHAADLKFMTARLWLDRCDREVSHNLRGVQPRFAQKNPPRSVQPLRGLQRADRQTDIDNLCFIYIDIYRLVQVSLGELIIQIPIYGLAQVS